MKAFTKTLLASGLLAAASTQAGTVNINVSGDSDAGTNFMNSLFGPPVATEDFNTLSDLSTNGGNLVADGNGSGSDQENWEARSDGGVMYTKVGTFTLNTAGQDVGGSGTVDQPSELMIESNQTGEFGREVLSDNYFDEDLNGQAYDFWLDSNDAVKVTWDIYNGVAGDFNAIGFYLADASDQGATLTLTLADNTTYMTELATAELDDENPSSLKFVSITSDMNIVNAKLTFDNNRDTNDGWGIDNVTLGKLPEPGTLLLMGLGLLGLGAARRRAAK